jgi:AcrR family transcriptional regulator
MGWRLMQSEVGDGRIRRIDARRNLESILESAAALLPEDPGASMQEIATAAGVHRATVHRHFASRDDLVAAVRRRALEAVISEVDRALVDGAPTPRETVEQVAAAILRVGDRYRLYRYTTARDQEAESRHPDFAPRLVALLAEAQRDGGLRTDVTPEQLAMALGGFVIGALPQVGDGRLTVRDGAALTVQLLSPPAPA